MKKARVSRAASHFLEIDNIVIEIFTYFRFGHIMRNQWCLISRKVHAIITSDTFKRLVAEIKLSNNKNRDFNTHFQDYQALRKQCEGDSALMMAAVRTSRQPLVVHVDDRLEVWNELEQETTGEDERKQEGLVFEDDEEKEEEQKYFVDQPKKLSGLYGMFLKLMEEKEAASGTKKPQLSHTSGEKEAEIVSEGVVGTKYLRKKNSFIEVQRSGILNCRDDKTFIVTSLCETGLRFSSQTKILATEDEKTIVVYSPRMETKFFVVWEVENKSYVVEKFSKNEMIKECHVAKDNNSNSWIAVLGENGGIYVLCCQVHEEFQNINLKIQERISKKRNFYRGSREDERKRSPNGLVLLRNDERFVLLVTSRSYVGLISLDEDDFGATLSSKCVEKPKLSLVKTHGIHPDMCVFGFSPTFSGSKKHLAKSSAEVWQLGQAGTSLSKKSSLCNFPKGSREYDSWKISCLLSFRSSSILSGTMHTVFVLGGCQMKYARISLTGYKSSSGWVFSEQTISEMRPGTIKEIISGWCDEDEDEDEEETEPTVGVTDKKFGFLTRDKIFLYEICAKRSSGVGSYYKHLEHIPKCVLTAPTLICNNRRTSVFVNAFVLAE